MVEHEREREREDGDENEGEDEDEDERRRNAEVAEVTSEESGLDLGERTDKDGVMDRDELDRRTRQAAEFLRRDGPQEQGDLVDWLVGAGLSPDDAIRVIEHGLVEGDLVFLTSSSLDAG